MKYSKIIRILLQYIQLFSMYSKARPSLGAGEEMSEEGDAVGDI